MCSIYTVYFLYTVQYSEYHCIYSVSDVPQAVLSLGSSLNGSNIKEGDDVYFECNVRSNPRPYKIAWRRNVSGQGMVFLTLTYVQGWEFALRSFAQNRSF